MITHNYDVVVIGSGAAGYNAACRIRQLGKKSVIMITEGTNMGTSRNTGSDKQTYYKLGLGGDSADSVRAMAQNLFDGGSVDGDNALCEAALSVRCFMNLCEIGVEFPVNRYGEYIGYKTDHDPYARATSAGPLTSKYMTEALQKQFELYGIDLLDKYLVIEILKNDDRVCGVLCVDKTTGEYMAVRCADIIMATGGPAGIYADSAYPACHMGSTGLALEIGAKVQNLTEWQYGLASISPRWNVSGTYMQVLPRFVSVDESGNEREFLTDYFEDIYEALSAVFLKGYQWPFDCKKVLNGSSVIDLLVYRECALKNRRVYLDFTKNPFGLENIEYKKLSDEAFEYLSKGKGCFGTPIERLKKMNTPAIELYYEKGVDLSKEYIEIALCAQHNNGGIAVDAWWQTNIKGLFAAGECAGTHGVTRPGGSALNAGQVGSLRAAQYISQHGNVSTDEKTFEKILNDIVKKHNKQTKKIIGSDDNIGKMIMRAQRRMSDNGAAFRSFDKLEKALKDAESDLSELCSVVRISNRERVYLFYKLKDILLTQQAVLTAMIDYIKKVGTSRGSASYYDRAGEKPNKLEELFRLTVDSGNSFKKVQEIQIIDGKFNAVWRDVREIPKEDDFFENVWRRYREDKNIY